MRTNLALLAALLLLPSLASALDKIEVPGGSFTEVGSVLVRSFACKDTTISTRGKSGIGFASCLRGLAMDPASGRTTAVVELVLDSKDPIDLADMRLDFRLDSGRIERTIEVFEIAASHLGDAEVTRPELYEEEWLTPTSRLVAREAEDARRHLTVAWNFQTWDPSIPIRFFDLKVVGGGVGGKARWNLDGELAWPGPWEARPEFLWDASMDDVSCAVWRVRKGDAGKASDALSDGAHSLPLQMRFDVLSTADDGELEVRFPDHRFTVGFAGGKLKVRGREDFTFPVDKTWHTGDRPNAIELVYDGEFVTVSVNGETFGPMAGRQRDSERFRWELDFDDAKNEIRDLQVAPCTLEDPQAWAAPDPKEVAARRGAQGGSGSSGAVVLAVLEKNGQATGELRRKRAKSALEVMQKAAAVGQGLMATGQALDQFGQDVNQNLDAMERGDVSSMKSSSTQVSVGPCGTTTTRSEARVTDLSSSGATVEMTGSQRSMSNPGCIDGQPASSFLPDSGAVEPAAALTLTVVAEADAEVSLGGDGLGFLPAGDRWVVQVAPGEHALRVNGALVGTLSARRGAKASLGVGREVRAEPAEVLR